MRSISLGAAALAVFLSAPPSAPAGGPRRARRSRSSRRSCRCIRSSPASCRASGTPHLLVPGGASPHSFTLRPSDARRLNAAKAVFWIGPQVESFLERPLEGTRAEGRGRVACRRQGGAALALSQGRAVGARRRRGCASRRAGGRRRPRSWRIRDRRPCLARPAERDRDDPGDRRGARPRRPGAQGARTPATPIIWSRGSRRSTARCGPRWRRSKASTTSSFTTPTITSTRATG